MKVISLEEIKSRLDIKKAITMQEEGFKLFSEGKVTVPPVGYMRMGKNFGEVHIKYGWIKDDEIFIVKIAGAYPQNKAKVQGMILVFNANTGTPIAILQDEGYLTNLRTAIAGLIATKYLAPREISNIGVIGTGVQARLQVILLKHYTDCRNVKIWGRNNQNINNYIEEMSNMGFQVQKATSPAKICEECNLIITTTSAREPLIWAKNVKPGTHITAVGADAPCKQELDPNIFKVADICVVDSKSQCLDHGETFHPHKAGFVGETDLVELGEIIQNHSLQRQSSKQITIADLTGVSVQDIQIAKSILFA
ncbi:MAG: Delta(1)-pyrroline-2-carboxylate reductase [Chlamydiales bacterium]|nr:Delta(1)-pyrroline-2-carboxylate reductase [Chlamydiales bacterium]